MIDLDILEFSLGVAESSGDKTTAIYCASLRQLITRLREAEMDAARYRWLRDRVCMFYVSAEGCDSKDAYLTVTGYGDDDSGDAVDAAIDEQMEEKGDE